MVSLDPKAYHGSLQDVFRGPRWWHDQSRKLCYHLLEYGNKEMLSLKGEWLDGHKVSAK